MKYNDKVRVTSWFYEGMTWEVTEVWFREKNNKTYIRVQNEMWNVLEPESSLELIQ